jgi:uridine phosphorylase
LRRFFDASPALVRPADLVTTFTEENAGALKLPPRAVITFDVGDMKRLLTKVTGEIIEPWRPFRILHRLGEGETVLARCSFGGPNIAALMEELVAFGVREFVLAGYCGAIGPALNVGDILAVKGALREDGVSYHYLATDDEMVFSPWFKAWERTSQKHGFQRGLVWSTDAIYRETTVKVEACRARGIEAVEMEVASCYAVAAYLRVDSIAFLVVSDTFREGRWENGFHSGALKAGTKRLADFLVAEVIR